MKLKPEDIFNLKKKKEKVTVLTAYDYPSARILDGEGVDVLLVGDSLGMVLLGYESTSEVTMEEMLHHTKAVVRAAKRSLVVADMPAGSYENPQSALKNAKRFIEEAGADAVKLEGGQSIRKQLEAIRKSGIPMMGHVGLLPQSIKESADYRVKGKESKEAHLIFEDAKFLDHLGAFAVVLECIPSELAHKISQAIQCPAIGIGAGAQTDGQVLVLHDMLGFGGNLRPKFVRKFASLEKEMSDAVKAYIHDVKIGEYPSKEESYN